MTTRRELLAAHYVGLVRRLTAWIGVGALIGLTLVAVPVRADQETSKVATLSDSNEGDTSVSYQLAFTNTTSTSVNAITSIRFQFCNAASGPIYDTSCVLPTGMVRGTTIATQTDNAIPFTNSYSAATNGSSDILLTNGTGNTFTAAHNYVFKFSGFTNPTTVGQFYVRVIMCNDASCVMGAGTNLSWGGFAVDTTNQFAVTGNVQEDLKFCVGQTITTPCSVVGGSTVSLTPNPLSSGGNSNGTAQMAVSTNASGGYVITYNGSSFMDGTGDIIAPGGGTVLTNSGGSEQFGFTLRAQTGGNLNGLGTEPLGGSGFSTTSPYNTQDSHIAYSTAGSVQVASGTGPTTFTTYTMLYATNVSATTKPGVYNATQTYIATATF